MKIHNRWYRIAFNLTLFGSAILSWTSVSSRAESTSTSQAWKNCQSQDTNLRVVGCTAIINADGAGSPSRLADALDARCWAFHIQAKYNEAIADCKAAIKIKPKYSYAYNNLGQAYLGLGKYREAIEVLQIAVDLKPRFFWSRLNRAKAYAALGSRDDAINEFQIALDIDPTNAEAKEYLKTLRAGISAFSITETSSGSALSKPSFEAAQSSSATQQNAANQSSIQPQKNTFGLRVALVIGNAKYQNVAALSNPLNDARLVAETLRKTGFQEVTLATDLGHDALILALRNFAFRAEHADWSVVYYAGHGMEVGGVNYLIPVDAKLASDRDIGFEAVALDQVLSAAERSKLLRLVILDACRNNPFASQMKRTITVASRSVSRGLASVEPDPGTLVVYAAKDGETALDGDGLDSPFAIAFAHNLQTPGLEVRRMFDFVRDDVMEVTGRRQKPFSYGSISGRQDFYFVSGK
jgi:tetratricopeptide (TPR) repeat protein